MFRTTMCLVGLFLLISLIAGSEEKASTEEPNHVDDHPAWSRLPAECGRTRFDNVSMRTTRDEEANLGQIPWMAQLGSDMRFGWGGAILSKYYILSAPYRASLIIARVGDNHQRTDVDCDLYNDGCAPPYQDIAIKKMFFNNDAKNVTRNIVLIELQEAIKFNDFVQPICLPRGELLQKNFIGETVQIAGWVFVNLATLELIGNMINVPILDFKECVSVLGVKDDGSQICVGPNKGRQPTYDDDGGPITRSEIIGGERRNVILGIVLYDREKNSSTISVQTKVAASVEWILSQITIG